MSKSFLLGIIGVIALLTVVGVAGAHLQQTPQQGASNGSQLTAPQAPDTSYYPVAAYNSSEPTDASLRALQQIRSSRHNKSGIPIEEFEAGVEALPVQSHWWVGLSALPTATSDAVILGKVVSAEAHLSTNKTSVYSEFTINIEEVLKATNPTSLTSSDPLVAEREGGAVRFPSGRTQIYSIANQGMPRIGNRYVFFLKYNEDGQDFSILTGYELRTGKVVPLDGSESRLPFSDYAGQDEGTFLREVRETQNQSVQGSPQQRGQKR